MEYDIEINELVWDDFNKTHMLEKHDVKPEEVEEAVFDTDPKLRGIEGGDRIFLYGVTISGRWLTILISPTPTPRSWYAITARKMEDEEFEEFVKKRGGVFK